MSRPSVVVLDYGSGNLRSVQRALQHVGAATEISVDSGAALAAAGLVVPGVGAFAACMTGLSAVGGPRLIGRRLAGGRAVLGICVGMQVLFEAGVEGETLTPGCGEWPGTVERLQADVLPHVGWSHLKVGEASELFAGLADQRFYFVHSYAARRWELPDPDRSKAPVVTWAEHGEPFVAAVENGPLCATQFHPEKSGDAGLGLLETWVRGLR